MSAIIGIVGTPFEKTKTVKLGFEGQTTGTRITYEQAIFKAGAIPIILSPSNDDAIISAQLNLIDGLLMQGGGGDIEVIHIKYIKKAYQKDIGCLGICMGHQLINVALGGKIGLIKNGVNNKQKTPLYMPNHNIKLFKNTKLFNILNKSQINVNSNHRYHITNLAKNIIISAISNDNIIEAIEVPNKKFMLGVQWHPEHLLKNNVEWLKLFKEFVNSCINY